MNEKELNPELAAKARIEKNFKLDSSNGKYTYKLLEKIDFAGEEITEFQLQKPRAKHIRNMSSKGDINDVLIVIGKLAAQPDKVIDELSMKDMNNLSEFFEYFS